MRVHAHCTDPTTSNQHTSAAQPDNIVLERGAARGSHDLDVEMLSQGLDHLRRLQCKLASRQQDEGCKKRFAVLYVCQFVTLVTPYSAL